MQLRQGQANDALEGVRNSLAQVSLVFRTKVREARSVYTRTRSWNEVQRSNMQVQQHVSRYRTARNALIQLRASPDILGRFMEIKREHLKMPGDIVEANRVGQRSDSLAWFWRLDADRSGNQEGWMKECKFNLYSQYVMMIVWSLVYRVNWLRAKARHARWSEELQIVQKEMDWTCRSFQHLHQLWKSQADKYKDQLEKKGHHSYALKQAAMWEEWRVKANLSFSETLSTFNHELYHSDIVQ